MNIFNIIVCYDNFLFYFCFECFKYIIWIEMILIIIELLMFYFYKKNLNVCIFSLFILI